MKTSELKSLLYETFGHLTDYQLMSLTIYGEARGEKYEGKVAVGSVILERVDHRDWDGSTIQEVCLMPKQFSCFLPNDKNFTVLKAIANDWDNKIKQSQPLRECLNITGLLLSQAINRTPEIAKNHATQYKTISCKAAWSKKMKLVATIGNHEFYA